MTTTYQRGYTRPILLVLLGIAALALTLTMDYFFGRSLGLDSETQKIMGVTFIGIDVIVVGLSAVNGTFFRDGQILLGLALGVFIVFGAALAMTATVGFGGAQRLGKTEQAIAALENANSLANQQNADARAQRDQLMDWLKKTAVKTQSRKDRAAFVDTAKTLALTPIEIKEVVEKSVSPDIQSEVLVRALGIMNMKINRETVQMGLVIAVAIFMTLAQSICFGLASYTWPVRQPKARTRIAQDVVFEPEPEIAHITPAHSQTNVLAASAANDGHDDDADAALAAALRPDVEELHKPRRDVQTFLDECTYASTGSRVTSTEIYNAYLAWSTARGDEDPLTQNMFGRICTSLRMSRDRRAWYVGLALRGDEEVALSIAA